MTAGLQIWNGAGGMILDATHRIGKVIAVLGVAAGQSGSWANNALVQDGRTPFAAFQRAFTFGGQAANTWYVQQPNIVISGNTVSWTYGGLGGRYDCYAGGILVIGVY